MTEERPEGRDESDRSVAPEDGGDGQEARRGPDPDAPFHGLRSAADIFGAPITEEEWPSRRERREAERAARQAGQPEPEPFTAPASVPASAPQADHEHEHDEVAHGQADDVHGQADAAAEPDPAATQAISMPEELALPGGVAGRVPPPAAVPPVSNAPDPRAISLPTARSDRDLRAAEARAIEDERRRTDPDGVGRDDVDWLGRARPTAGAAGGTPVPPAFRGGPDAQPVGVQGALPPTSEPPTFTELLRLGDDVDAAPQADRPFDWSLLDDQTGEVPTTLTRDAFDTNLVAADSWATGAPVGADPVVDPVVEPAAVVPTEPARQPGRGTIPEHDRTDDRTDERTTPSGSSWSLSDDAARTGEVFPGDVEVVVHDTAPGDDDLADDDLADDDLATGDDRDDDDLDDDRGAAPTAAFSPRSAAAVPPPSVLPTPAVPWWEAEDDDTDRRSAVPPLVEPQRQPERQAQRHPERQAQAGPQPRGPESSAPRQDPTPAWPIPDWQTPTPAPTDPSFRLDGGVDGAHGPAPEDIDQSEWQGRETSDTGVIKDLFGTEAIQQLRDADASRPEDTSTRMMPAVVAPHAGAAADGPGATGADRDNFINEGFARLQNEGRRGKQLLVYGSIAIIVVLLLLVLLITSWIRGNTIDEHPASPSSSPAAALSVQPPAAPPVTGD
ncbi:hypothetical protein DEJ24_04745 [Curtobacterium sp. MCPF17_001]|uniref:hypothetical protein n=1 Tax=Curtobacterium sp. MCPF17_001 TaxID=2175651 RepID=UPI000DA87D20|nr:hypothetical protein [Curtobacterium sp. MCPF17_001]PZE61569.1 hypothetical protein DEJ24_04745 [Curtobacterium sp. MCPF17_001]